ncbi:hypothetical protein J6590_027899 [Homalodisca vitripennis]|nr:hypothetical protein J6590_027899 [Homalodisca vitripennis]
MPSDRCRVCHHRTNAVVHHMIGLVLAMIVSARLPSGADITSIITQMLLPSDSRLSRHLSVLLLLDTLTAVPKFTGRSLFI